MKTILLSLALLALAATWTMEKISAARLEAELDSRREQQRELTTLQREHARLRALQPGDDELARLRRLGAEHARLQDVVTTQEAARATPPPTLTIGEWTPASAWKNCGQATPHAAIETALWAAAGGDVATWKNLLSLDEATRAHADALLARLPAGTHDRYATAEELIAEFTIKNIPLGEAQLVWFNQAGEDDATACVFLQNPPKPGETIEPEAMRPEAPLPQMREEALRAAAQRKAQRAASPDRAPPSAPENENSSETYLSLHRQADGWRLIVPPSAVDKIAKELASPPHS